MGIQEINSVNFIEVESVDEANRIDLNVYRFDRYSETKNRYIFVRRAGK